MSSITFQAVAARSAPRLAQPLAELAAALVKKVPGWVRPRPLTRNDEAARLRQLALQFHQQPSFAADLMAAADRHCQDSE